MNPHKYFVSADLISNPLCGIGVYKDTLNLASGQTTRKIKKLELTGEETWYSSNTYIGSCYSYLSNVAPDAQPNSPLVCTHVSNMSEEFLYGNGRIDYNSLSLWLFDSAVTAAAFKSYLAAQYAAGTPVTIWYVLETSQTKHISVPSGLSGTLEGSLTQTGTPTPSAPIYPTAVTGEGWYNINTYKRSVLVWNTDMAYERESGAWT